MVLTRAWPLPALAGWSGAACNQLEVPSTDTAAVFTFTWSHVAKGEKLELSLDGGPEHCRW